MVHNRECSKCGTIGEWNWAKEREEVTMPNGEKIMVKRPVKGEGGVKCPKCQHIFEPRVHALLDRKFNKLAKHLKRI